MANQILNAKTIIIGSGVSGISASVKLLDGGYNDFIVLEAQNRIGKSHDLFFNSNEYFFMTFLTDLYSGGRCFTIDYADGILEYGAQFIHGQLDNPIYNVAKENKLIDEQYNEISDFDYDDYPIENFLTQYGNKIAFQLPNKLYKAMNKAIKCGYEFGLDQNIEQDTSFGKYVYKKYIEICEEELKDDAKNAEIRKLINGIFLWRSKLENLENGCANIYDLSLQNICQYKRYKGFQFIEPTHGYKSIIDKILLKHRNDFDSRLRLNHSLKKILICAKLLNEKKECAHCAHTKDSNKIVLIVENESADKIFLCDNLICTMSLGCLKHSLSGLIEPNELISKERLDSVAKFGFGTINKIFLKYNQPFWDENLRNAVSINLVWLPETENISLEELNHHGSAKKWFENIGLFEVATNNPNVLIGWVSGNPEYENLDDDTVKNECTRLLRLFTGNSNFPEPESILRSKWNSNKYVRGSYSQFPLGSDSSDIDKIAEPIILNQKLLICFAGEHTHPNYFSTVHGAYLSGIREAERILNFGKS